MHPLRFEEQFLLTAAIGFRRVVGLRRIAPDAPSGTEVQMPVIDR